MNQKSFARRDSATAMLRKAGVDKSQYADYIKVNGSFFDVWTHEDIPLTHNEVKKLQDPLESFMARQEAAHKKTVKIITRSESVKKAGEKKAINAEALKGTDKRTVSGVCRQLVKDGKTNAEIWAVVKKEFKLTDSKKHYPAWYRAELARKGG